MKRIIFDLDNTICKTFDGNYSDAIPVIEIVNKIRSLKKEGYEISIYTSRNMRTYESNLGKIAANTIPIIIDWLKKHEIPCDELFIGKPWCGDDGFYVDDRAIRPSEFLKYSNSEIMEILAREIAS
jgi:capsule biosynthesis phosphatase